MGQNYGAGSVKRCRKTLYLCLIEGAIILAAAITLILSFGKPLLAIFNNDPEVVETGFIRLMMVMLSHFFSMLYDVMSGYLRGFGISLIPALLTTLGVCGIRIGWIQWVFPQSRTFRTIMTVYPISLSATALMILLALLYYRPSRRSAHFRARFFCRRASSTLIYGRTSAKIKLLKCSCQIGQLFYDRRLELSN